VTRASDWSGVVFEGVAVSSAEAVPAPLAPIPTRRLAYEPALDGVRALAVSAVVVFHGLGGVASSHLGRGGFLGVDVFFVLSGYLITTLLLRERAADDRINLPAFWGRRARRLLPALVLMLGIAVIYAHVSAPNAQGIREAVIPTLLYYQNWHVLRTGSQSLSHAWSLSVEEQWYLVWPVALGIALAWARKPASWMLWVVGGLTAASVLWTAHIYSPLDTHAYYGTETRGQALLVGAFVAILFAVLGRPSGAVAQRVIPVAGVVGLGILAWAFATWHLAAPYVYRGGLLLIAISSALVIIAVTEPTDNLLKRALRIRPLVAIGLVSYGIYLFNPLADTILDTSRTHLNGVPLFLLRIAVTAVVAILSFRLIERPFRETAARRSWPWGVLAGAIAVLLVATWAIDPSATAKPGLSWADTLRGYSKLAQSAAPGTTRVLVVGGSAVRALQTGAPTFRGDGVLGVPVGTGGCGVTLKPAAKQPGMTHYEIVRCLYAPGVDLGVAGAFHPNAVVVVLEPPDVAPRVVDGATVAVGSPAWTREVTAQLERIRARLPKGVNRLVVADGCALASQPASAAAARSTWTSYARAHADQVIYATPPLGACGGGDRVAALRVWHWLATTVTNHPH
jgi:peptidoglycan/LPS O-acetylase OafA/YrhL